MSDGQQNEVKQEPEAISLAEFLESIPPSNITNIAELTETKYGTGGDYYEILTPEIQLHCPDDACNGTRFFLCRNSSRPNVYKGKYSFLYISYICSNCRRTEKTFSLAAQRDKDSDSGKCYKFGELPVYGPPTPFRCQTCLSLLTLILALYASTSPSPCARTALSCDGPRQRRAEGIS